MRGTRHAFAAALLAVLACSALALADDQDFERRIEELERRLHELEVESEPGLPQILWDGTWQGRAPVDAPRAVCKHIFSPSMKFDLHVEGGKITGQARGRGHFRFEAEIIGELLADDAWDAKARGHAYGTAAPWSLMLSFSGDFTTGKGMWREAINGCRGELTLSRDE